MTAEESTEEDNDQTDYTVAEAELSDALANLPLLLSQARAVPYFRNGQSIGMRLFAIRSGSLYEKLGMKNGDIITAVNENSLSDPTQALRLFEQLKNERSIKVKMERNNVSREVNYTIR
jgi:general secretion pathway protein C